jgi:hypothetical protein
MSRSESAAIRLTLVLVAAGTVLARPAPAQHPTRAEGAMHATQLRVPESIRAEHEEIHEALVRATKAPGRVGEAARALAAVLHPHFVREEQIALPPLALLAPLARGEATRAMRAVLPMTDSLRAELPRMLEEHGAIRAATLRLGEVARAEGDAAVARLAETLAAHARSEEEVLYPAAVLVGDLVRARTSATGAP